MTKGAATAPAGSKLGWITAAVTMGVSMQAMDAHVASVALPTIRGAMSATPDEVSWILTASLISIAAERAALAPTGELLRSPSLAGGLKPMTLARPRLHSGSGLSGSPP